MTGMRRLADVAAVCLLSVATATAADSTRPQSLRSLERIPASFLDLAVTRLESSLRWEIASDPTAFKLRGEAPVAGVYFDDDHDRFEIELAYFDRHSFADPYRRRAQCLGLLMRLRTFVNGTAYLGALSHFAAKGETSTNVASELAVHAQLNTLLTVTFDEGASLSDSRPTTCRNATNEPGDRISVTTEDRSN